MIPKHELQKARQLYLEQLTKLDPDQSYFVALGEVAKIIKNTGVLQALLSEITKGKLPEKDQSIIEIRSTVRPLGENHYYLVDDAEFKVVREKLTKLLGNNTLEDIPFLIQVVKEQLRTEKDENDSPKEFDDAVYEYVLEYIEHELAIAQKEYRQIAANLMTVLTEEDLAKSSLAVRALTIMNTTVPLTNRLIPNLLRNELYYAS